MTSPITLTFLRDTEHGGAASQPQHIATLVAQFAHSAASSLDIAMYDFRLEPSTAAVVVTALKAVAAKGVTVRIGYDAGKPDGAGAAVWSRLEADPAPVGTGDFLTSSFAGSTVQLKAIQAGGQLMHSKYLIADGEVVWTGSTNFTDDAWTLQENNILTVANRPLAQAFTEDFEEMWSSGHIAGAGAGDTGSVTLPLSAGILGWDFAPGDGARIDAALVKLIAGARTRIAVASMVLTSGTVLAALAAAVRAGVSVTGIYDKGQMDPIVQQWKGEAYDATKLADFQAVATQLVGKKSKPYTPSGPHNFMHDKILVADDTVATGSYNFSLNAEKNAENQLRITNPVIADSYSDYIAALVTAYS